MPRVSLWIVEEVSADHAKEFHAFDRESDARLKFCELVKELTVIGDFEEILDCFDRGRFDFMQSKRWRDDIGNEVFLSRSR